MKEKQSVLDVKNLSISFGGIKAVDDLSFNINEKEIFGLIGPNGAGKTTVFNCITQFYKPNQGSIQFKSKQGNLEELTTFQPHQIIGLGLVRTFQNVELIRELSILDNVLVGAHIDFKSSILAQTLQTKKAKEEEKQIKKQAIDILTTLGIDDRKDMIVAGQPYGILKKVELARTLMCAPKLIILDEPAAGLNDTETLALAKVIRDIRDQYHCGILLVEHDMRLVMDVCDQICAINFGKLLAIGNPKDIQMNTNVQAAYLGYEESET